DRGAAAGKLIDLVIQILDIDEAEIVFFVTLQTVLVAQLHARVFDRGGEDLAVSGLAVNLHVVPAKHGHVGRCRDVDMAIQRVTKERTAAFLNSNHGHRQAANLQSLADGIAVGKKLVLDLGTQNAHESRTIDILSRDKSSV